MVAFNSIDSDELDQIDNRHRDRQGNLISLGRYCELDQDRNYVQVARTEDNGITVSTVWFGNGIVDFESDDPYAMCWFQTIVFETGVGPEPQLAERRYKTESEAIEGHASLAKLWSRRRKRTMPPRLAAPRTGGILAPHKIFRNRKRRR